MAKIAGLGTQSFLFPPRGCFGLREEGESYRGFSEAVDVYFSQTSAKSSTELAKEMRSILKGNVLTDKQLYFLPNLVAAWFYSESGRNRGSLLSGLILLDFIEAGTQHIDGDGLNLYSWKYLLVHPRKPTNSQTYVKLLDLYGLDTELGQFDGVHPMAHGRGARKKGKGSVGDARLKLQSKMSLTPVRQKEGHLTAHWLCEFFRKQHPDVSVNMVPVTVSEPLFVPEYTSIDNLLKASELPSKPMRNSPVVLRKWHILQDIKALLRKRLSSFDLQL